MLRLGRTDAAKHMSGAQFMILADILYLRVRILQLHNLLLYAVHRALLNGGLLKDLWKVFFCVVHNSICELLTQSLNTDNHFFTHSSMDFFKHFSAPLQYMGHKPYV